MEPKGLDAASGTPAGLRTPGRPLILVVEDDANIASAIDRCLADSGYLTLCARSGPEALEKVAQAKQRIEMVLLDWRLPGELSGSRLIHRLRAACPHRLPVVVISGDPRALTEASQAGVEDYLPKPFDLDDLVHVVDEHCR